MFCETAIDWYTARDSCEGLGMILAKADSDAINTLIMGAALQTSTSPIWIGGFDDQSYGWIWPDGELFSWTHWDSGEPAAGNRDCVRLQNNYMWGTLLCSQTSRYVCELP